MSRQERYAEADKEANLCKRVAIRNGYTAETARDRNLSPKEDHELGDLFLRKNGKEVAFDLKTTIGPNFRCEVATINDCSAKGFILTRESNGFWDSIIVKNNDKFRKWIRSQKELPGNDNVPFYIFDPPEEFIRISMRRASSKEEALEGVMELLTT